MDDHQAKITELLKFYLLATKLKDLIRKGQLEWNIERERVESVAEHIYGTCIFALALHSEFSTPINIGKVMIMLVIHELEELVIGDLTPFSQTSAEEKEKLGRQAVQKVLGNLTKKDEYLALTDEFNQGETPEAVFAKMCDKLEHIIQIKYYEEAGELDINNPKNEQKLQDPRIIKMQAEGEKTITDFFISFSKHHFASSPLFQEILDFVKKNDLHRLEE